VVEGDPGGDMVAAEKNRDQNKERGADPARDGALV
jgi:hypothetical protein